MVAAFRSTAPAALNAACPSQRMPFSLPAAMCMGMSATASSILLETGVYTSVSLFIAVFLICSILLVGLVALISLLLTGLTGLVGLKNPVGLTTRLATHAPQGE